MIEKVINASLELFDDSEIYFKENSNTSVNYGNGDLRTISSNRISGVMMRVKKAAKLGTASATTLDEPESLLREASESAKYGDQIPFSFSQAKEFAKLETYSSETLSYPTEKMIEICEQAKELVLSKLPDISLNVSVSKDEERLTVATSAGTRAEHNETNFGFGVSAPIRGAGIGIYFSKTEIAPFGCPEDVIERFIRFYKWTEKKTTPKTGRMPVIWAPQSVYMFTLSLSTGISGEELFKKTSPLMDKFEKKIFSEKVTIFEDPLASRPGARSFDDEGIPTEKRPLVEKGVLRSFLLDLRTASKLGARSTGNGFKRALFGGGTNSQPTPWPANLSFEPGDSSLDEMIASLDEGIILTSGLGFHSSNYDQGQIAVQAVGFMVEKGQVTGRLENTMVSGNIYEDFKEVRAVSKEYDEGYAGYYPYILVDSMQVIGK
jgi:PmbA protein